jgi:hypothetical protein
MMLSSSFIHKSVDAVLRILVELESKAALKRQEPAFIESLLGRIHELDNDRWLPVRGNLPSVERETPESRF